MRFLLIAIALFLVFSVVRQAMAQAGISQVSPEEAAKRVAAGQAVLIDVREPSEWASGVAEPAQLCSLSDLRGERNSWKPVLEKLEGREVLLYCRSGNRSGQAAAILAKEGYKVGNVGGFSSWQSAGLPVRQ